MAGDVVGDHLSIWGFFKQPGRGRGLRRSSWAARWVDGATCTNPRVTAPSTRWCAAPFLPGGAAAPASCGFRVRLFWQHWPDPRLGWGVQGVLAFALEQASAAGARASWERGVGRPLPGETAPEGPSPPDGPPSGHHLALSLCLLGPCAGERCVLPSGLCACRRKDGPASSAELRLTHTLRSGC